MVQFLLHPGSGANRGYELVDFLAWDDLQTLLTVCRIGSFRGAAGTLRLSVNTIRKRIERLEDVHGGSLFRRSFDGVTPTEVATKLIAVAERMNSAAERGLSANPDQLVVSGEVRIGASEAIGSIWLAPKLPRLRTDLGPLTVGLYCDYDLTNDRSQEMDVSLQFHRSSSPGMVCSRIATVHFMFYASRDYILKHGMPCSLDDIRNFHLVEQVSPGVRSDFVDALIGADRPPSSVPMRTNSSLALLMAVMNGTGIAAMPTYVHDVTDQLVPLTVPATLRRDLHLVYHENARGSPAIRATISWLKEAFEPATFPWFAERFVHPDDVPPRDPSMLKGLFGG